tara:strand:+ start:243 stop:2300 length:2058 start_codon:yes stop_codon:yes gene_type:complete
VAIDYEAKIKALKAEKAALDDSTAAKKRNLEISKTLADVELAQAARDTPAYLDDFAKNAARATKSLEDYTSAQQQATQASSAFAQELALQAKTLLGLELQGGSFSSTVQSITKLLKDNKEEIAESSEEYKRLSVKLKTVEKDSDEYNDTIEKLEEEQKKLSASTGGLTDELAKLSFGVFTFVKSAAKKFILSTVVMAQANEEARASFNASTGAAGAYDGELRQLEVSNRNMGISLSEHAASYGSLISTVAGFGTASAATRAELGLLGSKYAKVGVSASDFAGILQTGINMLGMSKTATMEMQKEAFGLAQTLGKDVSQVFSEMNQALPQLASYGKDAAAVFFDLERQAHKTGMAVGDLIGIAGNYRTFDSAATAAGNLNAVLGTQLFSTMGLLEAQLEGPSAVLDYMLENLDGSMGNFEELNTFQREAVANAANMSVEQLSILQNQRSMGLAQKDNIVLLEKAMESGRSLWQEMKIFFSQFAIAVGPLVDLMTAGFQSLNGFLTENAYIMQTIGLAMTFAFGAASIGGIIKMIGVLKTVYSIVRSIAMTQAFITGITNPLALVGGTALAAAAVVKLGGGTEAYAEGTDSTSGGMALVGEEGPELLVPPPNSAVVNNTTMTSLANKDDNTAVVAAVRALGAKMDTMISKLGNGGDFVMQVSNREFGRVINEHLGEDGFHPIKLRTA